MKWFKKYRILSSWKEGQCTVRMRRLLGDDRKYLLGLQLSLLEYELLFFFTAWEVHRMHKTDVGRCKKLTLWSKSEILCP